MENLANITERLSAKIRSSRPLGIKGHVIELLGTIVKAAVPVARIGEICLIRNEDDGWELPAEVIGFQKGAALLTPLGSLNGISSNAVVIPTGEVHLVPVSDGLLGRILDGNGKALDSRTKGPFEAPMHYPVYAEPPHPLERTVIAKPIQTGIRSIDGLLTCAEGQRMGIFAAAGVGKTTLMAEIARSARFDVIVIALIGERGREVREFIERDLGEEGLKKAVLVVSTSDKPPMERLKSGFIATAIAEYFRDQGKKVLLLLDSLTRIARAQREVGLTAGEPPTRRGFPPSVFSMLPKLLERAGTSSLGSITAMYAILVEGDDMTEPVADESRSILDGHIVLSREMATQGQFPAVDVLASVSRSMNAVVHPQHLAAAVKIRKLMSKFKDIEILVQLREYKEGSDALADEALAKIDRIKSFLKQGPGECSEFQTTVKQMQEICA